VIDKLILEQNTTLPVISFYGTNGFKKYYTDYLKKVSSIYCIPDAENNDIALRANFRSYGLIQKYVMAPKIIFLPFNGRDKMDTASYFQSMNKRKALDELKELCKQSKYLWEIKEDERYANLFFNAPHRSSNSDSSNFLHNHDNISLEYIIKELGLPHKKSGDKIYLTCVNSEHEDSTASMCIYLDTGSAHCFGCGTTLKNAEDFIMYYTDHNEKKAIELMERISHEYKIQPVRN
jgi:hypothetical protein